MSAVTGLLFFGVFEAISVAEDGVYNELDKDSVFAKLECDESWAEPLPDESPSSADERRILELYRACLERKSTDSTVDCDPYREAVEVVSR